MTRMVLYLARTLASPKVNDPVQVYGLRDDGAAVAVTVKHVDAAGITVEVGDNTFGCRIWHLDLPQVQ